LVVPPLRERPEDIPVLLRHFLTAGGAPLPRLSPSAWRQLVTYNWPGNIRELRTVADALGARETDRFLEADDLPANLRTPVRHYETIPYHDATLRSARCRSSYR